jgi:hypothetical protein
MKIDVKQPHQCIAMYENHAWPSMHNLAPLGWFIIRAQEVTKCTVADAVECVEGFSPVSHGIAGEFPNELAIVFSDEKLTQELFQPNLRVDVAAAAQKLAELEADQSSEESRKTLRFLLHRIKFRLVEGYDSANQTLAECPHMIFGALNDAKKQMENESVGKAKQASIDKGKKLLERISNPTELAEIQELMDDSQVCAGIRDERAIWTDLTAMGIIHHILLAVGKRLSTRASQESSQFVDASLVLFATKEEICDLLENSKSAPSASFYNEMLARKKYRETASILDAPPLLGGVQLKPTAAHFPDPYMARTALYGSFAFSTILLLLWD